MGIGLGMRVGVRVESRRLPPCVLREALGPPPLNKDKACKAYIVWGVLPPYTVFTSE